MPVEGSVVVYQFIDDNKNEYGLRSLCRKFNFSTNAYYSYLEDRKSDYRKHKGIILNTIKNIYYDNNRIIGQRKEPDMVHRLCI